MNIKLSALVFSIWSTLSKKNFFSEPPLPRENNNGVNALAENHQNMAKLRRKTQFKGRICILIGFLINISESQRSPTSGICHRTATSLQTAQIKVSRNYWLFIRNITALSSTNPTGSKPRTFVPYIKLSVVTSRPIITKLNNRAKSVVCRCRWASSQNQSRVVCDDIL
jgi:hypothetical protein